MFYLLSITSVQPIQARPSLKQADSMHIRQCRSFKQADRSGRGTLMLLNVELKVCDLEHSSLHGHHSVAAFDCFS